MSGLIINYPDRTPRGYQLRSSRMTIGRSAGNDVRISDPLASRVHAEVRREATGYVLEDLKSKNGTFCNGASVEGVIPLTSGARIVIGETEFFFDDGTFTERLRKITVVSNQLLKVFKGRFLWPSFLLKDALRNVAKHPDRIIKIAERMLRDNPNCEAAAFNKGVGLMIKKDESALDAFDQAIAIDPTDLWNWLQKAECLTTLGQDQEALVAFLVATQTNANDTKQCLRYARGIRDSMSKALSRQLEKDSSDTTASNLLAEYFSDSGTSRNKSRV